MRPGPPPAPTGIRWLLARLRCLAGHDDPLLTITGLELARTRTVETGLSVEARVTGFVVTCRRCGAERSIEQWDRTR